MNPAIRVLVVDDMPAMRMILRNMLTAMGFTRIEEAEDGDVAWQMLRTAAGIESAFGLVVADWNMTAMSGVELLRAVRGYPGTRSLPFLLVTAEGDREHLDEAFRAETTDYIVKPFTAEQLRAKIERALRDSG